MKGNDTYQKTLKDGEPKYAIGHQINSKGIQDIRGFQMQSSEIDTIGIHELHKLLLDSN